MVSEVPKENAIEGKIPKEIRFWSNDNLAKEWPHDAKRNKNMNDDKIALIMK